MKKRSPETMKKIRNFAEQYYTDYGRSPSTTMIANEVGVSRGTAYKYLVEMNEKGIISYDGKRIATALTQNSNADRSMAPIVGTIRCGSPEEEREEIQEYVSLPASIFGYGDFYILKAKGDSIDSAESYVDGERLIFKGGDTKVKIDSALEYLVSHVYSGLDLIEENAESDEDIVKILTGQVQQTMGVPKNSGAAAKIGRKADDPKFVIADLLPHLAVPPFHSRTSAVRDAQRRRRGKGAGLSSLPGSRSP